MLEPIGLLSAAVGASAALYALHYLRLAASFSRRVGLKDYVRWTVMPDIRVWIVAALFAINAGLILSGRAAQPSFPPSLVLLYMVPMVALGRALSSPQVLVLHTFDSRNVDFARWVALCSPISNVVSIFPRRLEQPGLGEQLNYLMVGIGCRTASDARWRQMVDHYMEWADVIVLDTSFARGGLIEELYLLSKKPKIVEKTVFFGSKGTPQIAVDKLRELFPDEPLLDRDARPVLPPFLTLHGLTDPFVHSVLSRLRTHFVLPLLPAARLPVARGDAKVLAIDGSILQDNSSRIAARVDESTTGDSMCEEAPVAATRAVAIAAGGAVLLVVATMVGAALLAVLMASGAGVLASAGITEDLALRYQAVTGPHFEDLTGWRWEGLGRLGAIVHLTWSIFRVLIGIAALGTAGVMLESGGAHPEGSASSRGAKAAIAVFITVIAATAVSVWFLPSPAAWWQSPTWVLAPSFLAAPDGQRYPWDNVREVRFEVCSTINGPRRVPTLRVCVTDGMGRNFAHRAATDLTLIPATVDDVPTEQIETCRRTWDVALARYAPHVQLTAQRKTIAANGTIVGHAEPIVLREGGRTR
jgi:hypothetical protein